MLSPMLSVFGLLLLSSEQIYKPVPLEHVTAFASGFDLSGVVTISQEYRIPNGNHHTQQQQEIVYVFPLDANSAVNSFSCQIEDGPLIKAVVKPKQEARQIYEVAKEAGHTAYLLEEQTRDVFRMSLGNVPRGKRVTVNISYVTEMTLDSDSDSIRFYVPTFVAPRYSVENAGSEGGLWDFGQGSTAATSSALKIELKWLLSGVVKSVESPSHRIISAIEEGDRYSRVFVSMDSGVHHFLQKDFVVVVRAERALNAIAIAETNDKGTSIALSFVPNLQLDMIRRSEFVFVVDNSGSMQGGKMEKTKEAMRRFIFSLPYGCSFNIVKFGSSFIPWKPTSVELTEQNLQQALLFIDKMGADMGGTEILQPLQWIFQRRTHFRTVFLLTDGEVSQEDRIIDEVRQHSGNNRVFSLGIGDSCSHHLVQGVAKAGQGMALFALQAEKIGDKVAELLRQAMYPPVDLKSVELLAGENHETILSFEQAPSALPAIHPERYHTMYFLASASDKTGQEITLPDKLRLHFESLDEDQARKVTMLDVPVVRKENSGLLSAQFPGDWIYALAVRAKIAELESLSLHDESAGALIEAYAMRYGLLSSRTSFVAVDTSQEIELEDNWIEPTAKADPIEENNVQSIAPKTHPRHIPVNSQAQTLGLPSSFQGRGKGLLSWLTKDSPKTSASFAQIISLVFFLIAMRLVFF
eukprot:TRINITY_DN1560_c0_g1_i1.p1 TRINITY_DN1560_c0_g1~~TRINITY_DN1560_c0_g1_i1.p1  ORF type:complete len:695 (-),score=206.24 TRINITY_DN1560_c0_g1_i1:61-2145(-)